MHGPYGSSGTHAFPNSGQSTGRIFPLSTSPQRQAEASGAKTTGASNFTSASKEAYRSAIRALLSERRIYALNLLSSPGSGKTTLIEALLSRLDGKGGVAVVEGDIETEIDADRIRRHGVQVRQINTRSTCHIQPSRLLAVLREMDLSATRLLLVENVGNLVCPAEVPLGEDARVVLLSVTEGDEKPLKYPLVFRTSDLLVITKTDLLPHVTFDVDRVRRAARAANPAVEIFEVSAATGDGMSALLDRIVALRAAKSG
jgi:hydrogenase nickel incorporation protein HypB